MAITKIEHIKGPVLFPRLRCPQCGGSVLQYRQDSQPNEEWALAVAVEPVGYLLIGGSAVLGFVFWPAALAWAAVLGCLLAWLFVRKLRRARYWCGRCEAAFPFDVARRAGRLGKQREPATSKPPTSPANRRN